MLIRPAAFVFESGSPVFVIASRADKMASRPLLQMLIPFWAISEEDKNLLQNRKYFTN
jgi:hypothetical protein